MEENGQRMKRRNFIHEFHEWHELEEKNFFREWKSNVHEWEEKKSGRGFSGRGAAVGLDSGLNKG